MGGAGLGSVSSRPMPRPVASVKVSRWFGEGLRQWRRPSRASSRNPCTRVTGGTTYGGGGAATAFHRSPSVPYFVWWGRWRRLATALEYALGYSDRAVVWALELPWLVGVQAAEGGWLCSWRNCGPMPCVPNPSGPPPVLRRWYLYLSVRGLLYLLLIWMWWRLKRRWTTLGLILILRPFRPHRRGLESPRRLPRVHQLPSPQP